MNGSQSSVEPGAVLIGRGPRDCEAMLLKELAERAPRGKLDPSALSAPLRVIVPSQSLRDHLCAALVRATGRAWLGLRVQTLQAATSEILERAGERRRRGAQLFPVLVRQLGRRDRELRRELDPLRDGYALLTASVSDLLDAGLSGDEGPYLERLGSGQERARRIVRCAAVVSRELARLGVWRPGDRLSRAARLLDQHGTGALPSRAVWIHGFAEATGRASDLIESLVRKCGARLLIDRPPDPLDPERDDSGASFTDRLLARLADVERDAPIRAAPVTRPLQLVAAPGADAEVREVAHRIRALLDTGERAESIGVVARQLEPYAVPLRRHFARLGIPFSGGDGAGPPTPERRRITALVELLQLEAELSVDRWLDALGFLPELGSRGAPEPRRNSLRADLSLALHALGAGRLGDVAELELQARLADRETLPLPVRRGLSSEADESGEPAPRAARRHIARSTLELAANRARQLLEQLEELSRARRASDKLAKLCSLLDSHLGWTEGVPGAEPARQLLAALARELPESFTLRSTEFTWLVERELAQAARDPLGGAGGGVQVLDLVEARGRTFEHLFALGLNRDVFPRPVTEDPLLPDTARERLLPCLPEIPIKRAGHREESYLFAQLLAASPDLTLSWQTVDDEGAPRAASSFVERARLARSGAEVEEAPPLWTAGPHRGPRPAHEHALLAGLSGAVERWDEALHISLRVESVSGSVSPRVLARAVTRARRERDPDPRRPALLGPYFGFAGPRLDRADPRGAPLFVTTLERYAGCPWQTLLTRLLRLEATPDALDALPTLDPRLIGSCAHRALERVVTRAQVPSGAALAEGLAKPPRKLRWPENDELDALLLEAARDVLLEEGVELPGLARALARRVRPYLGRARELVFPDGSASVFGAELRGELRLLRKRTPHTIHFKADLVESRGGIPVLSDYKTGKPLTTARRSGTRARHLRERIARGQNLQAAAYRAGGGSVGRYLFLQPALENDLAEVSVTQDDEELMTLFEETTGLLLDGLESGVFLPRILDPDGIEPMRCSYCEVAEACVRGDPGAGQRLVRAVERLGVSDAARSEEEDLACSLFRLPLRGRSS